MSPSQVIEADLTWTGDRFEAGVQVVVDERGRIGEVGRLSRPTTRRLAGLALAPGMVNAHSHAFQRGLRGMGESFPEGEGTFWTWRQAMYALVDRLDPDGLHQLSLQAFREMLTAGITCVGEFHYLHHDRAHGDSGDFAMDEAVLAAAREAGIRLTLLQTYYRTGGVGMPLQGAQRRFACASTDEYWRQADRLSAKLDARTQTIGVAPHSIRAAPIEDIARLHEESRRRAMVFHMHVEEQRKEVEECDEAYGAAPMAILNERLRIDNRFTAVHCTHTDPLDMERFLERGGAVCLCPLTEANLGDGVPDVEGMLAAGGNGEEGPARSEPRAPALCVGTDSNARICMNEELRWLEYVQRLDKERRGVVLDEAGSCGRALWRIATEGGCRSLGIESGAIRTGLWADFLTIDLKAASLAGASADTLLDSFIFAGGDGAVSDTCVAGQWRSETA